MVAFWMFSAIKPNLPFSISDIRALWRSGLSDRVPECQKLKMVARLGLYGIVQQFEELDFKELKVWQVWFIEVQSINRSTRWNCTEFRSHAWRRVYWSSSVTLENGQKSQGHRNPSQKSPLVQAPVEQKPSRTEAPHKERLWRATDLMGPST